MRPDHVVYGVADLGAAVDELAERLGVRPAPGGRHVGRGTHNALLGLGGGTYLEVIAADPEQAPFAGPLSFALDRLGLPRLVGWACRADGLDARVGAARKRGYDPGDVREMSRRRPDGSLLEWRLTRQEQEPGPDHLVVPFLIDWGSSPHPTGTAPEGVRLVELRAEHPDPARVRAALAALGATLEVGEGPEPALIATLDTPRGRVVLR
jgi:hypothetical protein